ncbi:AfsR/SARP family transcriptional regulator [Micromonospora cremea]|uniref:DNA-binding transcriptional activator of the SARP family n=1 Tax=Micromonospora cremea TaxID=709881 RepID=A0A1N5ZWQ3_9ACTN|nr:BTAD domain-containing putative transcriptional regulator [Micromonospora cremea]SIN26100.1 DNA-binding transcriptional activator of the SARP family [Micromonospora cremea]
MYEIQLFGSVRVRAGRAVLSGRDFGGVKPRQILALLALWGALPKDELAELLWLGRPPANHVATLESYVSVLRRRLDPQGSVRRSVILTRNGGYRLDSDRVSVDVTRFDALLAAAAGCGPSRALPPLRAALTLANEPLLVDEPFADWAVDARERYRKRIVDALVGAAAHTLAVGDAPAALEFAARALRWDPLAERGWYLRVAAHRAHGDRAAALRAYDECRRLLSHELGVEPSAELRHLFLDLLRQEVPAGCVDGVVAAIRAMARELAAVGDLRAVGEGAGTSARRLAQLLTQATELADPPARTPLSAVS